MDKIISCCGVICTDCEHYPKECKGCPDIKGKAYWLEYTGEDICDIYNCCVNEKKFLHCGNCKELPCGYYESDDPTKSHEENERIFKLQMKQLKHMD